MGHRAPNIIGLILSITVFLTGFFLTGNLGMLLNLSGLFIVLGGTSAAVILSYPMGRIIILFKVLLTAYTRPVIRAEQAVEELILLAVKKRVSSFRELEKMEQAASSDFFKRAIGLLVDNHPPAMIRQYLQSELYFFKNRRDQSGRVLKTMAEVAPSFGIVGSVVGLIGMLTRVDESAVILSTIPIALTSTLYGLIIANFLFRPFAANLKERTLKELFLYKIIIEGVVAISEETHPRLVEQNLKSFLTPSARNTDNLSIDHIVRQRFFKHPKKEKPPGESAPQDPL